MTPDQASKKLRYLASLIENEKLTKRQAAKEIESFISGMNVVINDPAAVGEALTSSEQEDGDEDSEEI